MKKQHGEIKKNLFLVPIRSSITGDNEALHVVLNFVDFFVLISTVKASLQFPKSTFKIYEKHALHGSSLKKNIW